MRTFIIIKTRFNDKFSQNFIRESDVSYHQKLEEGINFSFTNNIKYIKHENSNKILDIHFEVKFFNIPITYRSWKSIKLLFTNNVENVTSFTLWVPSDNFKFVTEKTETIVRCDNPS